ncbi:uracil-DNA glycosylase [Candidatus Binatia bacterium]|jgi:DNA polymerase|nr:uracil-DNA glycosylase [Candidatus Binatia bacterium]
MDHEIRKLAWQLAAHAEWQAMSGTRAIPVGLPAIAGAASPDGSLAEVALDPATMRSAAALPSSERLAVAASAAGAPSAPSEPVASSRTLDDLRGEIGDCRRCRLAGGRTQIVFGVGNPRARLMFVGEGPGRDEDLKGEPFVGRAGMLLTDIIEKGMRLSRADVYICNVVKCRPPDNRNPEPDEVEACSPFLRQQIALVKPEAIVALGKFAAQTLLATKTPIMRLRGNWFAYEGVPLMPTLHPAYLLRNPGDKKLVWQDIKQVMSRLGLAS